MIPKTAKPFPDQESRSHERRINDPARLATLAASGLMDSLPEAAFDRAVRLATRITGTPVGLLSLVDGTRQFFKAQVGLEPPVADIRETGLSHSFCQYVVTEDAPLAVTDAREHPLLRRNRALPDLGVIAYLGVPVRGPDGQPLGSFCTIDRNPRNWSAEDLDALIDISGIIETEIALRQTIAERQLVMEELNHRVKNIFAIVSGMVRLAALDGGSADELAEAIQARLHALSQAHELIKPVILAGSAAGSEVSIKELLSTILAPYRASSHGRIAIEGPEIMLGPKATTSLALAFHEMATNAAKYSALKTPEGTLDISWDVDKEVLRLRWEETGPRSAPPPDKGGFGTRLISITIEGQLRGSRHNELAPNRFVKEILLPLDALRA